MLDCARGTMRLVVVDDSEAFRSRVRRHLAGDPAIEVVSEVSNGTDALLAIAEFQPDFVLLDLHMPAPDGFAVLRAIKQDFVNTKVVVLTSDGSAVIRQRCKAMMADAVIDKADAGERLIPTLQSLRNASQQTSDAMNTHSREDCGVEPSVGPSVTAPGPPLSVLLVDDERDQYLLTQFLLEEDLGGPFRIDWAASFDEALARLTDGRYDVALIDYYLGSRTGVELLQTPAFRNANIPAVMLTGGDDSRIDSDALEAGAVAFLVKEEVRSPMLKRALRYAAERHRVTALLAQREASLRALLEDSADVIFLVDRHGTILFASESVALVDGYSSKALVGSHVLNRVHADDLASMRRQFAACVHHVGARLGGFDYRQQHRDGTWRDREAVAVNRLSEPGISAIVFTYRDVTGRKATEAQRAHLAAIVESSDDAIFSRTPDGRILSWNGGAERLVGYTAGEMVGRHVSFLLNLDDQPVLEAVFQQVRDGESARRESTWRRKDGGAVPVSVVSSPIHDPEGRVVGASIVARDITERLRIDAALRHSEARHRSTFDEAPIGMSQTALDGRWLRVNHRLASMLGYSREEMQATDFAALTHPDDVGDSLSARNRLLDGSLNNYRCEKRYRRKDGSFLWVDLTVSLRRDAAGAPEHFIAVVEDISARKQAQFERDHIFNLSPDMIATANMDGYFTRINPAWRQVLGYDDETLTSRPFLSFVHPDDRAGTIAAFADLDSGKSVSGVANRCLAADGSYRWLEWHTKIDTATSVIYAVARDQTARRQLEEQFRQAQKMEAVGRLAGGVAHDFNNLLTAIIGFSEIALGQLPEGHQLRDDVTQILNAGHSAASLTKQLLAFSRKQTLQPQVLDVGELIAGMKPLIRRVIGEDIALDLSVADGGHRIFADRGQVEQVVMNLVVNARDAMPKGGTVRLITATIDLDDAFIAHNPGASAGAHVRLTITDTGAGMEPDVLARLFEPFFTTKEPGKGTGLGLATVYGIVNQSGGHISVESTPGVGTSFRILFPSASADMPTGDGRAAAPKAVAGTETILVVEDQAEVRAAVRQTLERRGYRVILATDGPSALALLAASGQRVQLLLTDVVMPLMSGRELAERAVAIEEGLRVLYMSGYTDDAIVEHGVLEAGIDLISKPFTMAQLLGRVRALLDRPLPTRRTS